MNFREIITLVKDPSGEGFIPTIVRIIAGSDVKKPKPDRSRSGRANGEGKGQTTVPKVIPTVTTRRS